ncbi:MAG: hypothetical protein ACR2PR_04720, partial [Pseudohongiellaceae bacterium]
MRNSVPSVASLPVCFCGRRGLGSISARAGRVFAPPRKLLTALLLALGVYGASFVAPFGAAEVRG